MEIPNHLRSQIQGSTCSPSLSSEPPNVGKWFASYKYESPILGKIDGFTDSVSREGEVLVNQENTKQRCREETNSYLFANMQENESLSEIMDSSQSRSHVSEPPDIRNWFSSYVYESFVLDTNDDVKDTISQESECNKEGFAMGETQMEHEENVASFREVGNCSEMNAGQEICSNVFVKNNCSLGDTETDDKSLRKILDSFDSPPVFTEPPDVKNCFSSYAYESPALDASDQFEDSLHLERKPDNFVVEDSDGEKEEKLVIIRKVRGRHKKVDEQEKVSKSIDGIGGKGSPSSPNNLHSVKIFKESSEGRTLQSNDTSPSIDVKESSFNDEVSISKLNRKFSQEARSVTLNINRSSSSDIEKKSPMELFHRTDFMHEGMEDVKLMSPTRNAKLAPLSGASPRKQTHGRNGKENEPKGFTENGFVATRNDPSTRTENEDSWKRPQGILLEWPKNEATVTPAAEKHAVRRKVLTETTNYQNSDALEITGKWRCPQRSKPNRGPPLKQLRLGEWIHRF